MRETPKIDTLDQVIRTLNAHEKELRTSGVRTLSIFGSAARGAARHDSDIDIAVKLDANAHLGLQFFALERRISELLGRPVQILVEPTENTRLRRNLDRDRRLVF